MGKTWEAYVAEFGCLTEIVLSENRLSKVELLEHTDNVLCVSFSPDGCWFASCGADNTVRIWNVATRECEGTLNGHGDAVLQAVFSSKGQYLATCSQDGCIRVWSMSTMAAVRIWNVSRYCDNSYPSSVAFIPNNKIVSTSASGKIRIWDLDDTSEKPKLVHLSFIPPKNVCSIAVACFKQRTPMIAFGSANKKLNVICYKDNKRERIISNLLCDACIKEVVFSCDGKWLAAGTAQGTIYVVNVEVGKVGYTLKKHDRSVNSISFSRSVDKHGMPKLVSCSEDKTVRVWDIHTGKSKKVFNENAFVSSVSFSPDGQFVLYSCGERIIHSSIEPLCINQLTGSSSLLSALQAIKMLGENNNSNLTQLNLGGVKFNPDEFKKLIQIIKVSPALETLSLDGTQALCSLTIEQLNILTRTIESDSKITDLGSFVDDILKYCVNRPNNQLARQLMKFKITSKLSIALKNNKPAPPALPPRDYEKDLLAQPLSSSSSSNNVSVYPNALFSANQNASNAANNAVGNGSLHAAVSTATVSFPCVIFNLNKLSHSENIYIDAQLSTQLNTLNCEFMIDNKSASRELRVIFLTKKDAENGAKICSKCLDSMPSNNNNNNTLKNFTG